MKKVVVTGGAGFIGSHLTEELASRGYSVIVLDYLSTGKLENIDELVQKGRAQFIQGSIIDFPLLQKLFQGVDCVFHQAALARVPQSIEDPLHTDDVNIRGTLNVLLAAKGNEVKRLIFASSSSVYGDTPTLTQREDLPPNPHSPYAVTKLAGEYYCNAFQEIYGLSTICLRYFNVYGPRQDAQSQYATVIPAFIGRISQGLPPVVFGDGEQSRDFIFIEDVVRANIVAAQSEAKGIYNIGCGKSVTINQLAKVILNLMGKNLAPVYDKPRSGDPRHSLAHISRAESLGCEPKWTLKDGLRKTIAEFKQ